MNHELYAQDAILELDDTVIGNQEQPKVMNIVPWQPPSGPDHYYRPLLMSVDQSFERIERSEFLRLIERKEKEAEAQSPNTPE